MCLVHGLEVGISNFVYGIVLGYVFTRYAALAIDGRQTGSAEFIP